jgi:hypothetical protein
VAWHGIGWRDFSDTLQAFASVATAVIAGVESISSLNSSSRLSAPYEAQRTNASQGKASKYCDFWRTIQKHTLTFMKEDHSTTAIPIVS